LIYRPGQTTDAATELPNPSSRVFWVISRRVTRQTVFTFPADIPENKKKAMLRVQVRRWAPFPNVNYIAQWAGNRVSVFAWDDDEIKKAIADAGFNERRCTVCPETFIRSPLQNGTRLIAAIEGFEAQVWQDGFLAFSRWWPHKPGRSEWDMFLRTAAQPLNEHGGAVPDPAPAPFLEVPWNRQRGSLNMAWTLLEDPRYAAGLAALVAAPFIYIGVEYVTLAVAQARVENSREALSVQTQGIRKLRSEAIANLDEIEDYLSLEVYPSQFEILSTALGLVQNLNVKIPEWTYDVGALSFSLRADQNIDATFLITAFEKSGAFTNVTATRVGQEGLVRMNMDVVPRQGKKAGR
jgi:5-methylcytosine-specific restriction endonuclease McrA